MNIHTNTLDDIVLPAIAATVAAIAIAAGAASWGGASAPQATVIAQAPVVQLARVVVTAKRDALLQTNAQAALVAPSKTRLV
jgi:hypothetical protein